MEHEISETKAFGQALRAALHDRSLEENDSRIVYFFDADVVVGALFAHEEFEKDFARKQPVSRSIVRALFADGWLPRVRLATPHLEELTEKLKQIRQAGGIDEYLAKRNEYVRSFAGTGFRSIASRFKGLLSEVNQQRDNALANAIRSLGLYEFAAIEAESTSLQMREKGFVLDLIDWEGESGPPASELVGTGAVEELQKALSGHRTDAGSRSNLADAASIVIVSAFVMEDPRAHYRFYSLADPMRTLFESSQLVRRLLTEPGRAVPHGEQFIDQPNSCVRSSTYFILRSVYDSLSFSVGPLTVDQGQERQRLEEIATRLVNEETDPLFAGEAESLYTAVIEMDNRHFATRLIESRLSTVKRAIEKSASGPLAPLKKIFTPEAKRLALETLVECERKADGVIAAQKDTIAIRKLCRGRSDWAEICKSIPISFERWKGLGSSKSDQKIDEIVKLISATDASTAPRVLADICRELSRSLIVNDETLPKCIAANMFGIRECVGHWLTNTKLSVQPAVEDSGQAMLLQIQRCWDQSQRRPFRLASVWDYWTSIVKAASQSLDSSERGALQSDADQRFWLASAWTGMYVVAAYRASPLTTEGPIEKVLLETVIGHAVRCASCVLSCRSPEDVVWESALVAKALVLADAVYLNLQRPEGLRSCLHRLLDSIGPDVETNIYVRDALHWGNFVQWKMSEGGKLKSMGTILRLSAVAEPYQREHCEAMEFA